MLQGGAINDYPALQISTPPVEVNKA